ncbi:MAG: hypothetical protein FWG71_10185 [Synergistaceae bacterium]|nr:hypothetical protein [Synergistaceae bacterium]
MDDKGEILSFCDVDENISLQIWTKGLSPRLVIFNKKQNTRKLIRFSWLEDLDRKLSVKGKKRGESAQYSLTDLLPHVQRIISEYAVYTSFKPRLWKFVAMLDKTLHTPALVLEKNELAMLQEDKRSCLWLADVSGEIKGEGSFRPFFPISEQEKIAFLGGELPIVDNKRGVDDLLKTGITRKLAVQTPLRWHKPTRVVGAAILLAFSLCGEDGSEFTDEFWSDEVHSIKLDDKRLCKLGRKLTGYVRHFDAVKEMEMRTSPDSDKELMDANYLRKRRIEFQEGAIGNVGYSVTFFERDEDGAIALGCKPRVSTTRHKGDLIYLLPAQVYAQAIINDSFGGAADDYFTVTQLVSAKTFEIWSNTILNYISPLIGAI